jgi:SAM-dependent methyltransferase/uncharacterized protein YbaR (Trm112 family)
LRKDILEKITLICPACRRLEKDAKVQHALEVKEVYHTEGQFILEGFLVCPNDECGAKYPIVSGVPVIVKDLIKWWESEKKSFVKPTGFSPKIEAFFNILEDAQISGFEQKALLGTYMDSHFGDSEDFSRFGFQVTDKKHFRPMARQMIEPENGIKYQKSIDIGCSVGGCTFETARFSYLSIGMDNYYPAVSTAAKIQRTGVAEYDRKRRGKFFERVSRKINAPQNALFLTADALDPPFEAEIFDLVASLNVIENVKVPLILLGQMNALLKTSGMLLFSSPYEWREDFCESGEWLENASMDSPTMIRGILKGDIFPSTGFSYEIVEEHDSVPWTLKHHDRYYSIYLAHLFKARKRN